MSDHRSRSTWRPVPMAAIIVIAALAITVSVRPRHAGVPAAYAAGLVTNLVVSDTANAVDWSVQANLAVGSTQYGDRAFTFTAVPAAVAGADWIRTANDSKAFTGATLATFTVTGAADVYVASNDSITTKPSWMTGWTDSTLNLVNNETSPKTFSLFKKSFAAGATVTLGPNGNTSSSMYSVVVVATAAPPPPIIGNLVVSDTANAVDWSVRSNLQVGDVQYGDRTFTFTCMPTAAAGAAWIRTANDSKAFTGATLATFTVGAAADVYVAANDSVSPRPSWLTGWVDSGADLKNNESTPKTFSMLKMSFAAGATVTLGPNGSTAQGIYTVVVLPAGTAVAPKTCGSGATGPVLPPKWAFGVLYGSYHDQAGVLSDMNQLRTSYSGDLYWIDSSWLSSSYTGTPERYICYEFDPAQFPDPAGMVSTLRQNHFHFGVWEWPWMDQNCNPVGHPEKSYSFGVTNHLFVRDSSGNVLNGGGWHGNTMTGAFDYTNAATVTWWNQLNQPLIDMGLGFFKLDTGGTFPTGGVLADGNSSQDHYKALYRKTAFDLSAQANGGRGFVLTHTQTSTGADQTPGMWTGDTTATFTGLVNEMTTASGLNATNKAAFWCGDTGGYNQTPTDELYIRWLEYTAFTPCQEFFGAKTTSTGARFPWQFGAQAQQIFQTYTQLRYRLLPFRYSNAQIAYHESPVVYPVRWIGSTQIVNGGGQSQILVQPITASGATSASVVLPAGNWIDYWTGTLYAGGATRTIPAAIDRVPMLVKEGSIIPMGPDLHWVDEKPADPLTLDTYPAAASTSYTLYEDDGVTAAYQTGAVAKTTFTCAPNGAHLTFTVGAAVGTYTGQLTSRTYILKVNSRTADPGAVSRDSVAMARLADSAAFAAAAEGWFYDGAAKIVWVKFPLTSSATSTVSW